MLTFSTRDDKRICKDLSLAISASFWIETLKNTWKQRKESFLCCIFKIGALYLFILPSCDNVIFLWILNCKIVDFRMIKCEIIIFPLMLCFLVILLQAIFKGMFKWTAQKHVEMADFDEGNNQFSSLWLLDCLPMNSLSLRNAFDLNSNS